MGHICVLTPDVPGIGGNPHQRAKPMKGNIMYPVNPFTALRTCRTCHVEYPLACFNVREGRIGIVCRNCGRLHHLRDTYAWCEVCEQFQERRFHFNRYNEYGHLVPSPTCQSCHREHSVPVGSASSPTAIGTDSEVNAQEVFS